MEEALELIPFFCKIYFFISIGSFFAFNIGFFCIDIPSDFIWYLPLLPWKSIGRGQQISLDGD